MDFTYKQDIRELKCRELEIILMRLGMRLGVINQILGGRYLSRLQHLAESKGFSGTRFSGTRRSGRLPSGGLYPQSPHGFGVHWTPIRRYLAIPFYVRWLELRKSLSDGLLDEIRAFILAWQQAGGGLLDIDRCWVLTRQEIEVCSCRNCGDPFLREKWMVLKECQFCSGELFKEVRLNKRFRDLSWGAHPDVLIQRCLDRVQSPEFHY